MSIFYMETFTYPFQSLLLLNQLQFISCILPARSDLWETRETKENNFDFT